FRGYDPDLKRNVAIKVIKQELVDQNDFKERFLNEAVLVAKMNHSNIVNIYSVGEEEGILYQVMEYIDGVPLDKMPVVNRKDFSGLIDIFSQILNGLEVAHQQKIIHRDLKPSNIIINKKGEVKILDFGISLSLSNDTRMTVPGTILGTLAYLAPEVVNGQDASMSSDIYALGIVFYELLTGKRPFSAETPFKTLENIRKDELEDPQIFNPNIPSKLSDIILRMSAKDSKNRPKSIPEIKHHFSQMNLNEKTADPILSINPEGHESQLIKFGVKSDDVGNVIGLARKIHEEKNAEGRKSEENSDFLGASTLVDIGHEFELDDDDIRQAIERTKEKSNSDTKTTKETTSSGYYRIAVFLLLIVTSGVIVFSFLYTNIAHYFYNHEAGMSLTTQEAPSPNIPSFGEKYIIPGIELTLMPIESGQFSMGSDSGTFFEKPAHDVHISRPFWIGRTEVTQAQWEYLMLSNPSFFVHHQKPVERVSWEDAVYFTKQLTAKEKLAGRIPKGYEYRLPTETEWEYSCRAGSNDNLTDAMQYMAWFYDNSDAQTQPVATKTPNAWGLHDFHGNVWEWCIDWGGNYSSASITNPTGPSSGTQRILRGGGWDYSAYSCRATHRIKYPPSAREFNFGFRIVLAPTLVESIMETEGHLVDFSEDNIPNNTRSESYSKTIDFFKNFEITSASFNLGNFVKMSFKGDKIVDGERAAYRGINVIVTNKSKVLFYERYDTFSSTKAAMEFANKIESLPNHVYVAIAVCDEGTEKFTKEAQEALHSIGANVGLFKQPYRSSYILIGRKGLKRGEALEIIGEGILSYPEQQ
ncbi:MAG: SUMF1/EgtB/PvdO family nonheme iron enzyme, partial [Planctomycetes bacterium]|nr:SUMF1/EgtB/PvdO family nonheme iron enzyme [Planctomycetota bacterium]